MAIRVVSGILHIRFQKFGREISQTTGLQDTRSNRIKAQEMEVKARERLALEVRLGQSPVLPQSFETCAMDLLTWIAHKHKESPGTVGNYSFAIRRRLIPFFGPMLLQEIHSGKIQDYINSLSHLKATTLRSYMSFLSAVFEHGKKKRWCEHNPVLDITDLPSTRGCGRSDVVISEEDEEKYFASAIHPFLADFSMLLLLHGFRPGELLNLKPADIDFEKRLIHVCRRHRGERLMRKTVCAERTLPLVHESEEIFRRRMAISPFWLFCSARNPTRGLNKHVLGAWHKRTLANAGLSFHLYAFRHTFATRQIQMGTDISTLQKLLGHSSITMTQKYVHIAAEHERNAMIKYAQHLSEKAKSRRSQIAPVKNCQQ